MKKRQILLTAATASLLLAAMPLNTLAESAAEEATAVMDFDGISEGAVFEEKELDGHIVYAYAPSEMYTSLTSMLNRFYYYPDEVLTTADDAWNAIQSNGLVEVAEENKAAIFVFSPVDGESYGSEDYDFWLALSQKLASTSRGEESFMSYGSPLFNKAFMTGEGAGADFVTEYLAGDQVASGMISGVLLTGGTQISDESYYAVPAYLDNCSEEVIEFYKEINGTDEEEEVNGNTAYYNSDYVMDSGYTPKRVIVQESEEAKITEETSDQAWNDLFRRVYRQLLNHDAFTEGVESAVLLDRPVYEEMNIQFTVEELEDNPHTLYEWVPDEVYETMENGTDETYPLIVVFHGNGDHPIFEAESNGWVQLADDENVIVVAGEDIWTAGFPPESGTPRYGEENVNWIRNYVCEKFPVDMSRIYVTGFSIGGFETADTSAADPSLFAAAAAMAYPADGYMEIWPFEYYEHEYTSEDYDFPMLYLAGKSDNGNMMADPASESNDHTVMSTQLFFNEILAFNEMYDSMIDLVAFEYDLYPGENDAKEDRETGEITGGYDFWDGTAAAYICQNLDFEAYPYFGWDVATTPNSEQEEFTTVEGITYTRTIFRNEEDFNMLEFLTMGDMGHNHYNRYAQIIWNDFFSKYSRDPETGVLSYDGVEATK